MQTYKVALTAEADTDPAGWWTCEAHNPEDAAEAFIENGQPTEDRDYRVVVLGPWGSRQRYLVEARIVVRCEVSEE